MKRIIACILIITMIFSMVSVYADDTTNSTGAVDKLKSKVNDAINKLVEKAQNIINELSDIKGHWAKDYIDSLIEKEIVDGYPDGSFKPNNTIKVNEFLKLTNTALGYRFEQTHGDWARPYIENAINIHLIQEGQFDEYNRPILREEMASIIVNAVYRNEEEISDVEYSEVRSAIKDYSNISDDYKQAVVESYKIGIITGKGEGNFDPQGTAKRAESATVIMRLLNKDLRQPFTSETPKYYDSPMVDAKTHFFQDTYDDTYSELVEINDDNREAIGLVKEILKIKVEKEKNNEKGYISTVGISQNGDYFGVDLFRNKEDSEVTEDVIKYIDNIIFNVTMKSKSKGVSNTTDMDTSNFTYNIFIGNRADKTRYDELMEYHKAVFEGIYEYLFVEYKDCIINLMKEVMYEHVEKGNRITKKTILNGRTIMFRKSYNGMQVFISNGDESTKYNTTYSDLTGNKAYDFTLENLEGQNVRLSDHKGKKVLVAFFTSWCHFCEEEMPILQELYTENDNIEIIAINIKESIETVQKFKEEHNLDFTILLDKEGKVSNEYLIKAIPSSFFINQDGEIYSFYEGNLTKTEILKIIEKMN